MGLMPLMISCTLFIIQGFCGCDLMSYYAITIFEGYGIHENLVAIIYQLMITVGYVFSPLILSRLDCRPHFIIFLMIFTGSMLVIGSTTLFPSLKCLAIPALILNGSCYGLGVGPVPYVLMSTLFPQRYKSTGLAATQITRALAVCIQVKAFPQLLEYLGLSGILLISSVTSLLGGLFTFFVLPNTRNKSIYELEQIFLKMPVEPKV